MTNITKKRNNAIQDREPSPTSSTDNPTLQELKQRHAELERQLRKYKKKQKTTQPSIKPLIRPKGEAGNRKRGFILYDAMEMSKVENGAVVYDRMRDSVRKACVKFGINLAAHYRYQDHEKLGQVFHSVRKSFPYLTTDRFPHNWAIADMVKGYLAGTRKQHHRQAREDESGRNGATNNPSSKKPSRYSDTDDMRSSSSTKSGKAKTSTESDVEDPTDDDLPSTKPSTQTTTRSNSGSNSGKSSTQKRTAATDADIEAAASKRQKLTHGTTKSAGKQRTTTCDPVDVELENDDSDSEEGPVPSTRRASQTQTQNRAPIQTNAEVEEPVVKGQRSTRSAKSVGKQQADARDSVNIALENDDSSEEEPAPASRRTSQTRPSSQTKCKDKSGEEDESDAN